MLDRLLALFGDLRPPQPEVGGAQAVQRSAAALMVLAAELDGQFGYQERETVLGILSSKYDLPRAAAERLVAEAGAAAAASTDLFGLTRDITAQVAFEDRAAIVEMLWEVAYADGTLHDYEANLVRRVAGLLHVSDHDSGAARRRVLERRRADPPVSD
ncbi:MAG: TerB family tellurite resistance protein [Defluviicoccus sp.]|nr:TerB family tellurite resistance protein [Defluviicoccus sp.]MDG4592901.1 TerB family tellurite resistance protein [Defluviicoccus sp.]MDS4011275.1 TerB family tellurite resistance protein [Defluviicoccus sp.]MDS4073701.1 TerB family tellurite resistance protein [Defluviicoccus sp.]